MKNGKKKLQSLFFILWNILGQTEGFLLFYFAGRRNMEYIQHSHHRKKKKVKIYYSL